MRILFVSYPLLPVSDQSCGGAEQMLWTLEREFHSRGHETAVAACEGSQVAGKLVATGAAAQDADQVQKRESEHNRVVLDALEAARASRRPFDLVHDEGGLFWRTEASRVPEPILVSLHLPLHFYGTEVFATAPANVTFSFVSASQKASFVKQIPSLSAAPALANGIALDQFPFGGARREYLLWLGRICPEKGTHIAIEVARMAGLPLVIAGQVYPFSDHQRYFQEQIAPKIGNSVSFLQRPGFRQKCELLAGARAVLLPTLVDETSSLVAMEAMASGTPVVAFRRGALPEVVEDGTTGFLVDGKEEMLAALQRTTQISAEGCRARVEQYFSATRMASDYEALYSRILKSSVAA
jgi:glycosyltransferase involved in cell wall biosynthesis